MSRAPLGLVSALLCLTLSGCAGLAASTDDGPPPSPRRVASHAEVAEPTPTPTPLGIEDLVGEDGRLTVLILGSDLRKGIVGERTDAIIVASLDPASGKVGLVSLPRDTVNVPIAPGKTYAGRINSLFFDHLGSKRKKEPALRKFRDALAYAFDVEIDYYAMVDFGGLVRLINSIGGIRMKLDEAVVDPTMHIGKNGLRLKKGQRRLDGRSTLAFSRSRHSDSDYGRSKRQHKVLVAAGEKVRSRGLDRLSSLVAVAGKKIITDLPLEAAPALLELAGRARLSSAKSMVLAPSRWARPGPLVYTIVPRVTEVRKMFARVFKPVR